jgi:hypothetical protein
MKKKVPTAEPITEFYEGLKKNSEESKQRVDNFLRLEKLREAAEKYSINMSGINVSKTVARQEAFIDGATSPEAGEYWNEWISVDDELPDHYLLVLASNINDGWVVGAEYDTNKRLWFNQFTSESIIVTHWANMPSPPKTK